MEDPNSDDWLPPGWTVEVKVRKNGKRDKYYFAPSSGLKFNSRVEVFRHLDSAQNKVSIQKIAGNVVVEKGVAEGLPQGWLKKTRITTKGDTIRRDSYYIDPVSGYAFRSIKDADRYLQSGEIGRNAFKPKDKESRDMEIQAHKFSSADATMKPPLTVSMAQSSDLDMVSNDQQIPKPAYLGDYMPVPISEHLSGVLGTELTGSVLLRAEGSDQREGKVASAESALVPSCTDEDAQEKKVKENAQTKQAQERDQFSQGQNCQRKNRHKREINLPRRASKRLAGIKVDPVPELKTRSRARRVAVKQSGEGENITNEHKSPNSLPNGSAKQFNALEDGSETKCKSDCTANTMGSPKSGQSKDFFGKLSTPEKHPEKTLEVHGSDQDQECFSFLPLENHATVKVLESRDKVDSKLDYSLDFPLGEILTDPCIAFAIQTLTGVTFETSKTSQISSEIKSGERSETSGVAEEPGKKIKGLHMGNGNEGGNVLSPPENFAIPQEHAGDAKTDDKADENIGSSSEKALDISWMDPCIEFAIKTLTGTIPMDTDQNPKNCLQQQLSSSNTQGHCEMALSSVSLDNMRQTDYYCSQYFGTQKPMFIQQSFVDPTLQNTRNVGIGNSAGARLPHCGEDRRNIC